MASFPFPRPWRAEPMDPKRPEDGWQVVAGSLLGKGKSAGPTVATHLSQRDAEDIASGVNRIEAERRMESGDVHHL